MQWFRLRTYNIAPIFLGTDGLTDSQKKRLDELTDKLNQKPELTPKQHLDREELLSKEVLTAKQQSDLDKLNEKLNKVIELTPSQKEEYDKLITIRDSEPELPKGAQSLIKQVVKEYVMGYHTTFGSDQTEKGLQCEEEGIELMNLAWFKEYNKSESHLKYKFVDGHPDVEDEDELMILDNKCSWTKDTFPILEEDIDSSTYEWQGKMYCFMKRHMTKKEWRKFRLVYTLVTTPESIQPSWESDDLHIVDHLDIRYRITFKDFYLSDQDIDHMTRRIDMAYKFAKSYYEKLINKQIQI